MSEQTARRPADDAPWREQARAAVREATDRWKRQAADAGREAAGQARAALVRRLRHVSAETRKHRPSAATALALMVAGLWLAHTHRLVAVLLGPVVATFGAVAVYAVTYGVQYGRARHVGDVEWFATRRPGRNARRNARRATAGTSAFGGWLTLLGAAGVGAASVAAAVALGLELLVAALLTWLVCRDHWTHLWAERRSLREVAEQRTAGAETPTAEEQAAQEAPDVPVEPVARDPRLPDLLHPPPPAPTSPLGPVGGEHAATIQSVLAKHGVDATVTGYIRGPVVTRYEVELAGAALVKHVLKLADDFAVALGGLRVRLVCPVPGRPVVGVEVPNAERDMVDLADILQAAAMRADPRPLVVCVGKGIDGKLVLAHLPDMPHILIAGTTGGGKSELIKAWLTTVLSRATPDEVRALLIDPKRVELNLFAGIPHLVMPIVKDPAKAIDAIGWLVGEMDRRYLLLEDAGVVNIDEYNALPGVVPLACLLAVIDELADLMMLALARRKRSTDDDEEDVEALLIRLLQLARAAGIHLILATQRPSVDIITGLIKANLPSRLALAVASGADSRVILDAVGAERLLGKGDALYQPMDASAPIRVQAPRASRDDILRIAQHWRAQAGDWPAYDGAPLVATSAPASPRQPVRPALSTADVVLAVVWSEPGCSSARIASHEVWAARGGAPSQSQLSRATGQLTADGLLTRVKQGTTWTDYRITEAGRARGEKAAAALGLDVADDAARVA